MVVRFDAYLSRERVAAMLEAPARVLRATFNDAAALATVAEIIMELDRMDDVTRAKQKLNAGRSAWNAMMRAKYVKIVPALPTATCDKKTYSPYPYLHTEAGGKTHRAKVTLNGVPYCLTHRRLAEEQANNKATMEHRAEYVEDAALRDVIDANVALMRERAGYNG